ncbi:hypothetical protein Bbelb_248210 [Branchiostoma belcheri]|nr:hypothetical protein Bbelb_248210 [Branchiostoma belcheri]
MCRHCTKRPKFQEETSEGDRLNMNQHQPPPVATTDLTFHTEGCQHSLKLFRCEPHVPSINVSCLVGSRGSQPANFRVGQWHNYGLREILMIGKVRKHPYGDSGTLSEDGDKKTAQVEVVPPPPSPSNEVEIVTKRWADQSQRRTAQPIDERDGPFRPIRRRES